MTTRQEAGPQGMRSTDRPPRREGSREGPREGQEGRCGLLRDRVVLITGAAGGLGRAMARAFTEAGARLALLDQDERGLVDLATEIGALGGDARTAVADLSTAAGVQDGIEMVLTGLHHQVDVLVSNVGVFVAGHFADMTDEEIERGLTMNLLTHIWACRYVLPLLAHRPEANIILVGSDQGSQPDAGTFPYAPAKAALHCLARQLARDYAPTIRVNAIAPGMTRTPPVETRIERLARDMHSDRATAERIEVRQRGVLMARLAEPEEVAEAVVFLAHHRFCTGAVLDLSGGSIYKEGEEMLRDHVAGTHEMRWGRLLLPLVVLGLALGLVLFTRMAAAASTPQDRVTPPVTAWTPTGKTWELTVAFLPLSGGFQGSRVGQFERSEMQFFADGQVSATFPGPTPDAPPTRPAAIHGLWFPTGPSCFHYQFQDPILEHGQMSAFIQVQVNASLLSPTAYVAGGIGVAYTASTNQPIPGQYNVTSTVAVAV